MQKLSLLIGMMIRTWPLFPNVVHVNKLKIKYWTIKHGDVLARDARAKFAKLQAFGKVTFVTAIPCTCMVGITNYRRQGVNLLIICCWNENPSLPSSPLSGIFFHPQPKSELGSKFSRRGMLKPFLSANGQGKPFTGGTASQNLIAQALKGILISNSHPYIGNNRHFAPASAICWWVEVGRGFSCGDELGVNQDGAPQVCSFSTRKLQKWCHTQWRHGATIRILGKHFI